MNGWWGKGICWLPTRKKKKKQKRKVHLGRKNSTSLLGKKKRIVHVTRLETATTQRNALIEASMEKVLLCLCHETTKGIASTQVVLYHCSGYKSMLETL